MSRSDFIRLTLFRLISIILMLAVIAGSFYAYGIVTEQNAVLEQPVPTPTITPEPTPDAYIPAPPEKAPPASGSDLAAPGTDEPTAPKFLAADGSPLVYEWGTPIPAGPEAGDDWFADAAFIGNSLCDGLMLFGTIDEAKFHCAQSINVENIYNEECINAGGGEYITIIDALEQKQYNKIFIMLGINEVFRESQWFYDNYAKLIDHLRDTEPEAEIYIHSILPVTQRKSSSGTYTRANVQRMNEQIISLCKNKEVFYIDVYSHFADAEGYLPSEASSDGVHLIRAYYEVWSDYLKTHTITEVKK